MDQLRILGVEWPPGNNWKQRVIGKEIGDQLAEVFVSLKDKHLLPVPPFTRDRAECRSCQAPIFWVRTAATDSLMPLDWLATVNGNVAIDDNGKANIIRRDLYTDQSVIGDRYTSHFATCPNAAKHRRKK